MKMPLNTPFALADASGHSSARQDLVPAAPRASRVTQSAFTMVEIALSLAIIGFALVAVIGVLPTGLNVQRENREETIINQDANVWLSALRNGARGYNDLTNYVDAITNFWTRFNPDGSVNSQGRDGFERIGSDIRSLSPAPFLPLTNGYTIIGLLSTPKYEYRNLDDVARKFVARSNYVIAYVRAMSGAATEKFPQDSADVRELAFRYRMISEVVPHTQWDTNWVSWNTPGLLPAEAVARSNYWWVASRLYQNLHDVRLTFRWPLLPRGKTGNGRQVFRATTGGILTNQPPLFHFLDGRAYTR